MGRRGRKGRKGRKGADPHGFSKGDRVRHHHQNVGSSYEGTIVDIGRGGYLIRFDEPLPGQSEDTMWVQRHNLQLTQTKEEQRRLRMKGGDVTTSLKQKLEEATKPKPKAQRLRDFDQLVEKVSGRGEPAAASEPEPERRVVSMAEAKKTRFERDMAEWESMRDAAQKRLEEAQVAMSAAHGAAQAEEANFLTLLEEHRARSEKMQAEQREKNAELNQAREKLQQAEAAVKQAAESLTELDDLKPEPPSAAPEPSPEPPSPEPKPPAPSSTAASVTDRLFLPDDPHPSVANTHAQHTLMVLRFIIDWPDGQYNANELHRHFGDEYEKPMSGALSSLARQGVITRIGEVRREEASMGRAKIANYKLSPFVTPEQLPRLRPLTASEMVQATKKGNDNE